MVYTVYLLARVLECLQVLFCFCFEKQYTRQKHAFDIAGSMIGPSPSMNRKHCDSDMYFGPAV